MVSTPRPSHTDLDRQPNLLLFTDQIHSSDINLEPEYQRGMSSAQSLRIRWSYMFIAVVWPEAKQIGIIDSILRNFYIPPVIFCMQSCLFLGVSANVNLQA
jgi:hypothetical protein